MDIRKWMLNIGVVLDPNAPNVYIYHHLYKQPFKSSMQCNHFAFMRPHSGETTDYIYENKGYDDEEQDKDAKKQNSVPQKHNSLKRNNVSSENFKKKKSKILTNWLQKVSINEKAVKQLESNSLRHEEMESRIIIIDILSNIVNQIEENEKIKNQLPIKILKGRKELPWSTKATVIYFYLHPQLAQENIKFTENIFGVNSITVLGWLRKKELRARWMDYGGNLSFDMVLKSIQKPYGKV